LPAPEIPAGGERLADEFGPERLSIDMNQASVRPPREEDLRQTGYRQRVYQTGEDREKDYRNNRRTEGLPYHIVPLKR
jgi:hypothetical protein